MYHIYKKSQIFIQTENIIKNKLWIVLLKGLVFPFLLTGAIWGMELDDDYSKIANDLERAIGRPIKINMEPFKTHEIQKANDDFCSKVQPVHDLLIDPKGFQIFCHILKEKYRKNNNENGGITNKINKVMGIVKDLFAFDSSKKDIIDEILGKWDSGSFDEKARNENLKFIKKLRKKF